jgi:hypothetical protein
MAFIEKAAERTSTAIDRLTKILVTDARQDERLKALELRIEGIDRRVDRLERSPGP